MRFSVLLPTRNGGPFLESALDSVLRQQGDFELVVGDNANEDQTTDVLRSLSADRRVRIIRSDVVLTVTENWMRCLDAASGEYMLMIGDDDYLLPGFFGRVERMLHAYGDPDALTFNGYSYVAPGSIDASAPALWAPRHFDLRRLRPDRELPLEERVGIVRDMFRFRVRFPLNMQLTVFSRRAVAATPGDFFRAPFPDHFALNSLLLRARRLTVTDERLLIVGVSPKSFGHYFYGGQQSRGTKYLGSSASFAGQLEGSELLNSMYAWLLELQRTYPELKTTKIARWQYAARQANHWYRQLEFGRSSPAAFARRARSLRPWEVVTVLPPIFCYRIFRRLRSQFTGRASSYIVDSWPAVRESKQGSIADFAATLPLA